MYNIGDKIVYAVHGAGTIVDIQEIEILNNTEKYYILLLPINDIKISIPESEINSGKIRPIITKAEGKKVMEILKSEKTMMSSNWGKRYRENLEQLKSGDIFEIADIVRNLTILDNEKTLSASEKKMLNDAKRVMVSELVIVGSITKEEASEMIDEAITL
ncbi:CarD family transcriptional regulator [Helcococcus sueciensis]|uniref:CarD family transcriptional regulator n=1 Tax=Helcococcus sueciensis TaxID=241555 RepID=UPI000427C191|nr:CarD family transcriptional regulator [Helcococcus sueciensis]